jgi:hypothetical protein
MMPTMTNNSNNSNIENNLILEKIQSYDAIQIETYQLLKREQTLFMINSVVTLGLLITLFKVL